MLLTQLHGQMEAPLAVPCMVWTWFVVLVGVVSDLTRFLTLVCVECLIGKQKKPILF